MTQRYTLGKMAHDPVMIEDPEGKWVKWDDYVDLLNEHNRSTAEIERPPEPLSP